MEEKEAVQYFSKIDTNEFSLKKISYRDRENTLTECLEIQKREREIQKHTHF